MVLNNDSLKLFVAMPSLRLQVCKGGVVLSFEA